MSSGLAGLPRARPVLDSEGGSRISTSPRVAEHGPCAETVASVTYMSMRRTDLVADKQEQCGSWADPGCSGLDPPDLADGRDRCRQDNAALRDRHPAHRAGAGPPRDLGDPVARLERWGVASPAETLEAELLCSLDRTNSKHLALMHEARWLFSGAGAGSSTVLTCSSVSPSVEMLRSPTGCVGGCLSCPRS